MKISKEMDSGASESWRRKRVFLVTIVLAGLALFAPWLARTAPIERVGVLLLIAASFEILLGFRCKTVSVQRSAWGKGAVTLAMGVLLLNSPWLAGAALLLFIAGWFGIDGVLDLAKAVQSYKSHRLWLPMLLGGLGNITVAIALLLLGDRGAVWALSIAGSLRIVNIGINVLRAPVFRTVDSGQTVLEDLGLPDQPEMAELARDIEAKEAQRGPIDRVWIAAFALTLFAIHLGRTGLDRTFLGIMTPGLAVLGDFAIALILAFVVFIPTALTWRRLTRPLERRLWTWCFSPLKPDLTLTQRLVRVALRQRLRFSIRLRQARYSLPSALSRGLQIGLPAAAIIAATAPMFGMSWYFDTENWAAGIWNTWAEERTDTWRAAMVEAERERPGSSGASFSLSPAGVADSVNFSFVVIGDTGEGDASQHILRDSFLSVVQQEEVRFVVLSSDVVYPVGAMKDYEAKFWLPFKGTDKPVYAIPGNHDWYDTLEAFNATFLEPDAARTAIRARIKADHGLTTTTPARIDQVIDEASRLRGEYRVPTGFQRGPFFNIQTDRFALIAVDTGVARTVDPRQREWLRQTLEENRGKLVMAVLGHPFYAAGENTAVAGTGFGDLKQLLHDYGVKIVMAGDTHDFEYYAEKSSGSASPVHHFVNGGGGAYLSFGTALAWPQEPVTQDWAYYPTTAEVVEKINATVPFWKKPIWWWTRQFHAWPFSAELLAGMFDVNKAPFYQSFVQVVVEPTAGRVRILPYGIYGRLRWSDLEMSETIKPDGSRSDDFAEWVVEMPENVGTRN